MIRKLRLYARLALAFPWTKKARSHVRRSEASKGKRRPKPKISPTDAAG